MERKTVNIGMIGSGRATELHMSAYRRVRDISPVYKKIVSKDHKKALKAKEEYGFEQACHSIDEILEDEEIEVVDICTPPNLHEDIIIKALKAGKNVICEKPVEMTVAALDKMLDAQKRAESCSQFIRTDVGTLTSLQ